MKLKQIAIIAAGALVGFGYYYFVGCRTGACPITSSPFVSTAYGALIGLILALPNKKKSEENN